MSQSRTYLLQTRGKSHIQRKGTKALCGAFVKYGESSSLPWVPADLCKRCAKLAEQTGGKG